MKKAKLFMLAFAALAFAACTNEKEDGGTPEPESTTKTAYLSISISTPTTNGSRASSEQTASEAENKIGHIYVITFDAAYNVIKHADAPNYYQKLDSELQANTGTGKTELSNPIKVNPNTKYLLVVANANTGSQIEARILGLTSASTYTTFNAAIQVPVTNNGEQGDNKDYLVNDIKQGDGVNSTDFTMINVGFYDATTDPMNPVWEENGLLDVSTNIVKVDTQYPTEGQAEAAAKAKKANLKIERLTAKMEVTVGERTTLTVLPLNNSQFDYDDQAFWTLDYRNSTYFPYAVKKMITTGHGPAFYENNFYTVDPNYSTMPAIFNGIVLNAGVIASSNPPEPNNVMPTTITWRGTVNTAGVTKNNVDYAIENTMLDPQQAFGAATRLVLKGRYAPFKTLAADPSDGFNLGDDWYYLGTTDQAFQSFDRLKAAYMALVTPSGTEDEATSTHPLVVACRTFLAQLKTVGKATTRTNFSDLLETDFTGVNEITNGGQLSAVDDCIRWYQGSVSYYYYEIRHDNLNNELMAFGKYGVVRNNWYALDLTKVNGRGTPWYPGTSPEDPDPEDPIDEETAFLDFDIEVGPWVYWRTDFEI